MFYGRKKIIKKELSDGLEKSENGIASAVEEYLGQSVPGSVHEIEKFHDEVMNEFSTLSIMLGLGVKYEMKLLKIDENDKEAEKKEKINEFIADINSHFDSFFGDEKQEKKAEDAKTILKLFDSCLDIALSGASFGRKDLFLKNLEENFEKNFNIIL